MYFLISTFTLIDCRKFAAPSSSASSTAPAAPNAFASTKFVASDASPQPSSSNPFATVQLKSGTTAPPSFSFGALPKSEPKPFSFGPSSSQQQPSSKSTSQPSSKSKVNNTAQIEKINTNFFKMIQDHVDNGHICNDLTPLMEQYIKVAEDLHADEQDDAEDVVSGENDKNSGVSALSGSSLTNDENKSQSSSTSFSGFSFASSSAAPPSSKGTTFSFTGGSVPAPAAASVSKPSFSFGVQPAAPSSGGGSSNAIANEDDPTSNPDDGKLDIGKEENEDEKILHEVRARLIKMIDGKWNKLGVGVLRLYSNNKTEMKRMVLRNEVGKVMFNVAIGKGMQFKKSSQKTKKGEVWRVGFMAVEDEKEGAKQIMLNVKKEDVDEFHEKLEELAA